MRQFIRTVQDFALLVARLVVGAIMIVHGVRRFQAGPDAIADKVEALGLPWAEVIAWATIGFEVVGGILLVFGLVTPLIGGLLLVEQGVLVFAQKFGNGFDVMDGGYEYNMALAALGLLLMAFGSGRAGIDVLLGGNANDDREESEERFIRDADPA
ncbi:DoxX family protein [Propionibacteriaceae bacterium G1746]|uniref:DoxX family protein n=1 Tax=Aestuariimicrobium sp. G57 TaxID=3418485 RepID=UPI003C29006D